MNFTWDPAKRLTNIAKHGVDFVAAYGMDWSVAVVRADLRYADREARLRAVLPLGDRLYSVVFTIGINASRIISMRKASNREVRDYEAQV